MGRRKTELRIADLAGRRWSAADAREVLRLQASSGLSLSGFAREHGLSRERLYRWRRQERVDATEHEDDLEGIEFAPVVVTGVGGSALVVVRVGDVEIGITEPDSVDASWLARVVSELRRR